MKVIKFMCVLVGLCVVLFLIVFIVSTCHGPSEEDKEKLRELVKLYGDRYDFQFVDEFYLHMSQKQKNSDLDHEVEEIYKAFFFKDFDRRKRRDTSYVYLNVFTARGGFLYQLAYDPQTDTFIRGRTPHY